MAAPFKDRIGTELVQQMAHHLGVAWAQFPRASFVRRAARGLARLELKQRVVHVADALAASLPVAFADACDVLERALLPETDDDDLGKLVTGDAGLAGWAVWPMTEFVARRGLCHPERALDALHALTRRHTAEFAIRPFLVEHRALTERRLARWVRDPNPHVRRLVSEGTRPRLPWGVRLQHLVDDPSPSLPLLERLQDDGSAYVRRSVANHLNDIAKDHADLVADWVERHLPGCGDARAAVLRRASRTLVKRGDPRILAAFGFGEALRGTATLAVRPSAVAIGHSVRLDAELVSRSRNGQRLVVDYVVHQVRKDGSTSAKVWKGWRLQLAAGERRRLERVHSLRPVTTRRLYPGTHRVALLVNGIEVAHASFELLAP